GELSLGGEVRPVPGILPMVAALARRGLRRIVVPAASVDEAGLVEVIECIGVETLHDAAELLRRRPGRRPTSAPPRVDLGADATLEPSSAAAADAVPVPSAPFAAADLGEVRRPLEARRRLDGAPGRR